MEQLASSYSVLSEDEKELGVCIVDIGGGTTDIAIFNSGSISFTVLEAPLQALNMIYPHKGLEADEVDSDIFLAYIL